MTVAVQSLKKSSLLDDLRVGLLASLIPGLFCHFAIPLYLTPVPLYLQPMIILMMSALLGKRRALIMVSAFLFEGLMGLPVFSFGRSGLMMLIGPTGGYLIGYLAAAFIAGSLLEKKQSETRTFYAIALGSLAILLCGMVHLASFVGFKQAFTMGILPFIGGDIIKILVATKLVGLRRRFFGVI